MIAGKQYKGLKADIWSCGIILYALVCGHLPFEDPSNAKLYQKIQTGEFTLPKFLSLKCRDLIRCILHTDPDKRYSINHIKNPWCKLNNKTFKISMFNINQFL